MRYWPRLCSKTKNFPDKQCRSVFGRSPGRGLADHGHQQVFALAADHTVVESGSAVCFCPRQSFQKSPQFLPAWPQKRFHSGPPFLLIPPRSRRREENRNSRCEKHRADELIGESPSPPLEERAGERRLFCHIGFVPWQADSQSL